MPLLDRTGARIWWETVGSGSPLLLIQGLGYSSEASWRLVPLLAGRHTVIQLDNRGVGRSDVSTTEVRIEAMAADAAAVVEAAGLGPAHVVGLSMGGLIAQAMLLERAELVRSVVLGCTSPGGTAAVPFSAEVAAHLAELATVPAREAAERSASVVYSPATPARDIAADIEIRMARPTSRAGYLAQLTAVGAYAGALPRLGEVERPVLVLHGSDDRLVPPENAAVLARAIPGSRSHIISGAGHIFTTDATAETVTTMLDFFAEHDPPVGTPGA